VSVQKCLRNRPIDKFNYHPSFTIPAYLWSGPDSAGARSQAKLLVRPHLPLLRGRIRKALINLCKAENDDINALNVRSIKNSRSLPECPTNTALVAAFDKKAVYDTELIKSWLAGRGLLIFAGKPTENVIVKYLIKHMAYVDFYKFHICFFFSVLEKPYTLHMCDKIS